MTTWNDLTPATATAAAILKAGKQYGIKESERCDLSDLLHGVSQKVLFEMLDLDEHTALFLMSGSSMPTTTMIEIYNAHAGMKNPREVQEIRVGYEARIKELTGQAEEAELDAHRAEAVAQAVEAQLRAAEHEIVVLKARLYDLLIAEKEETPNA